MKILLSGNRVSDEIIREVDEAMPILKSPSIPTFEIPPEPVVDLAPIPVPTPPPSPAPVTSSIDIDTTELLENQLLRERNEARLQKEISLLTAQTDLYQKEILQLKFSLTRMQNENADFQRQLDSSALRITELEQHSKQMEFHNLQLTESLKHTSERCMKLSEDKKTLSLVWEAETNKIKAAFRKEIEEKCDMIDQLRFQNEELNLRLRNAEVSYLSFIFSFSPLNKIDFMFCCSII